MLDLGPIKARALAPQTAEFAVNAVDDIDALVEEVERLRQQHEIDQLVEEVERLRRQHEIGQLVEEVERLRRQHQIDQARLLRWMARRCDGAEEV